MSRPVTVAGVLAEVARVVGADRVPAGAGPELLLSREGLWLSSLELVEVVAACEEAFGVFLDPETDLTTDTLHSVGSLVATLEGARVRAGGGGE
jgi:acyl carrier protein